MSELTDLVHAKALEKESQIRKDERDRVIAEIRVGLGKVQTYEHETDDSYICFKYYKADKVLALLSNISNN